MEELGVDWCELKTHKRKKGGILDKVVKILKVATREPEWTCRRLSTRKDLRAEPFAGKRVFL